MTPPPPPIDHEDTRGGAESSAARTPHPCRPGPRGRRAAFEAAADGPERLFYRSAKRPVAPAEALAPARPECLRVREGVLRQRAEPREHAVDRATRPSEVRIAWVRTTDLGLRIRRREVDAVAPTGSAVGDASVSVGIDGRIDSVPRLASESPDAVLSALRDRLAAASSSTSSAAIAACSSDEFGLVFQGLRSFEGGLRSPLAPRCYILLARPFGVATRAVSRHRHALRRRRARSVASVRARRSIVDRER